MFPYQELRRQLSLDIAAYSSHPESEPLTSDLELPKVRAIMLGRSFLKKLCPTTDPSKEATAKALEKFKAINRRLPDPDLVFGYPVENEADSVVFDYFEDNFRKSVESEEWTLADIGECLSAGPGASIGTNNDNFYTKLFASRASVTSEYLLALFRAAISNTDAWAHAEMRRNQEFGVEIVSGNRLFFVNKDVSIARTCCTEPSLNMLVQKGIGGILERILNRCFGINLSTQPDVNRELARQGSIDGSYGTIDLSSASDSISWSLVKRVCPTRLITWLKHARCESTALPSGRQETLRMISTMGNGFTFPLQTLIFACAVKAVYQAMGLPTQPSARSFSVFGDDIIVRREAYSFVCRTLSKLGFEVNDTKSFNSGPFRESCGYDYFNGHFVRGVYVKSLETRTEVYSAINRLHRWVALSGIPLPRTLSLLYGSLRRKDKHVLVPFSEQDDAGIKVAFRDLDDRRRDSRGWFAYRKLASRPKTLIVPKTREDSDKLAYSIFNEYGWLVTFLGGFARRPDRPLGADSKVSFYDVDAEISVRSPAGVRPRYNVVTSSIPFWDWGGPVPPLGPSGDGPMGFSYSSWEAAVARTIS